MEMLRNWQEIRIEIPNRREALGVIIASKAFDLNLADYVRYFAPEMSFFEKGLDGCPREHNLPQVQRIEALLDEGTCLAELLGMRDFRLERQKEFTEFFDGYGQRKLVFIELSRLSGSAN